MSSPSDVRRGANEAADPQPAGVAAPPLRPAVPTTAKDRADALLDRTRRWPLAAALAFRVASAVGPVAYVDSEFDRTVVWPVLAVALGLTAADAAAAALALRSGRGPLHRRTLGGWIIADLVVAVGVNLWSAVLIPGAVTTPYHDVFWYYLMGSVILCTGSLGPAAGALVVTGSLPLQLLMTVLEPGPTRFPTLAAMAGRTSWLAVGLFAAWLALKLIRGSVQVALEEGIRAGRQAEQIRTLRALHDTVLQTLEGIALLGGNHAAPAEERLDLMVAAARNQSEQLRAALTVPALDQPMSGAAVAQATPGQGAGAPTPVEHPPTQAPPPGGVDLADLGLRLTVQSAGPTGDHLSPAAREALRLSVQEALTNVARHAAASRVTVRATCRSGLAQVVVDDDGRGFRAEQSWGFGITQSIIGRLGDVGGHAQVRSTPGRGTQAVMWVPLRAQVPAGSRTPGDRSQPRTREEPPRGVVGEADEEAVTDGQRLLSRTAFGRPRHAEL